MYVHPDEKSVMPRAPRSTATGVATAATNSATASATDAGPSTVRRLRALHEYEASIVPPGGDPVKIAAEVAKKVAIAAAKRAKAQEPKKPKKEEVDHRKMPYYIKNGVKHYSVPWEGFKARIGSKAQVWHGIAYSTKSGITKDGLLKKPDGHIVFKSRSLSAKNGPGFAALVANGLVATKGTTPENLLKGHRHRTSKEDGSRPGQ